MKIPRTTINARCYGKLKEGFKRRKDGGGGGGCGGHETERRTEAQSSDCLS